MSKRRGSTRRRPSGTPTPKDAMISHPRLCRPGHPSDGPEHSPRRATRPACARGAAALSAILAMVVLQLLVVATVVSGTRDVDLGLQRADSARAFYACEAGVNMAIREIMANADADGSGAIGGISPKTITPETTVTVTASGSGPPLTLTSSSSIRECASRVMVEISSLGGDRVTPFASYGVTATPTAPTVRVHSSGAWGAEVNTAATAGIVAWQVARNSPFDGADPSRALVTLSQTASLSITRFAGGAWGGATTLTTATGTSNTRVFAAEYEHKSGELMVAYRKASDTAVYYRTYTSATPAEQWVSLGFASAPTWMEIAQKPRSSELVLVAASGGSLRAAVWNGSAWGNTTLLETSLSTLGRPYHAAYMNLSGAALVVWTATTGAPKYATWNGSAWSSASTLPAIGGGAQAGWIKLAGSPLNSSNEVLIACIGRNNQVNVNTWSGTAWGANLVVEATGAAGTEPRADVAYQPDGLAGLVVWHRPGQAALQYRTRSGGAWSVQQVGPNMATETHTIRLEHGYNPAEIMMLARRRVPSYADYHTYTQAGNFVTGTTSVEAPNGQIVPGITLPTPPSATANSNHISPSSGTVAPGTYGNLNLSGTVGFTAGIYVFQSVTVGNSATMNFNTSGGPIHFIVTNGNFVSNNDNNFINTGTAPVVIHVLNGHFETKNNTLFTNIDVFVYNGNFECKNDNVNGALNVYASGNIEFKNNGTVTANPYTYGASMAASAVLWTGGSPGPRVDLTTSLVPAGIADPLSLAGSPIPPGSVVESWTAVAP